MKKENYSIAALILIFVFSIGIIAGRYDQAHRPVYGQLRVEPVKADPLNNPYSLKFLDEHEVQLISKKDTVSLLLENSSCLADEYVIFVKK